MSEVRRLRVVPFSPHDYSLSENFGSKNGTDLDKSSEVSAAFSLYFQWPKHRFAVLRQSHIDEAMPCEISYDRDEREPTMLWIDFPVSTKTQVPQEFQKILVRMEIFKVAYEFETVVIANEKINETAWRSILEVPHSIRILKQRRLPRYSLEHLASEERPKVRFTQNEKQYDAEIVELGLSSLVGLVSDNPLPGPGTLLIHGREYPAEAIRQIKKGYFAFQMRFETGEESGSFFDFARTYIYPELKSRYEIPFDKGIELYEKTGYLSKYKKDGDASSVTEELKKTWEALKTSVHHTTADYYIHADELQGASGLAAAFESEGKTVWAFHQLCIVKEKEHLTLSSSLFTWRADYLAMRPENLAACCWYDSKSRWLERIYTKFCALAGTATLVPVTAITFKLKKEDIFSQFVKHSAIKQLKMGTYERLMFSEKDSFTGVGPDYLNVGGHLNALIDLSQKTDTESSNIIENLLHTHENGNSTIRVTALTSRFSKIKNGDISLSNRFAFFNKEDLPVLRSSVEHAVAVTEAKFLL